MGSRALVIDDSRAMRRILGRILAEAGFDVAEAGSGQEALDLLDGASPPELALVDWNMPGMSGFDFVKRVRTRRELDGLRIVMVTTENEAGRVVDALDAGADEYVMKPFTTDVIRDKLALLGMT